MTKRQRPWLYRVFDVIALLFIGWFTVSTFVNGSLGDSETHWFDLVLVAIGGLWFAAVAREVYQNWKLERSDKFSTEDAS